MNGKRKAPQTDVPPGPWKRAPKGDGWHITAGKGDSWRNIGIIYGMRPDTARLVQHSTELLALAHKYASECGECAGTRIMPDGKGGDEPCDACTDIWEVIDKAEARP